MLLASAARAAERPQVGVWMSPGGPSGIWEKSFGDPFPVKMIVGDLAELEVTDIFFFEQAGRGGPFLHPTKVRYAETQPRMKERDWLGELLAAAEEKELRIWLAWTPPGDKYPGTDFRGLNHPAIQKIYLDEIEEVAARYGRFRSLAGFMWHEVDCSEAPDLHEDDREEFSEYCRTAFGRPYTEAAMPPAMDPLDPWWRRFALYKVHVVNQLVARTAEAARRHGLQMHFCSYTPETFSGQSWRWGRGQGTLRVDVRAFGLPSPTCRVFDVVTGASIGEPTIEQQPFLTFKHSGKGAAIYLVGQVGIKSDPRLKQILRNALAPETLRWLCWQPPDK